MTEVDLYNLEPILELMAVGLAVAALPLGWWLWRQRSTTPSGRLKALTLITLFLTFDLVLFGAFTRLTDSGLGCPDWPGCYGSATPMGAKVEITAAQTAMPTGPVTHSKAWIEMVHRYLATGVGVLILTLAAMTWWLRRQSREVSPWLPTFTLVWVCMQGAFGALTVTMKLFPAIVTLHLMGGIGLLVLLMAQAVRYDGAGTRPLPSSLRAGLWAGVVLLGLQIALGGWVSTNYAVLACPDFPTCHGSIIPDMDFSNGFSLLRDLGLTSSGESLSIQALHAIQWTHRLGAIILVTYFAIFSYLLSGLAGIRFYRNLLISVLVLQFIIGVANLLLHLPIALATIHNLGAALLVIILVIINARMHIKI